jgi:hypothetical protein
VAPYCPPPLRGTRRSTLPPPVPVPQQHTPRRPPGNSPRRGSPRIVAMHPQSKGARAGSTHGQQDVTPVSLPACCTAGRLQAAISLL